MNAYVIYYDKPTRSWWGFWQDSEGDQLHDAFVAHQRDDVLLMLGSMRSKLQSAEGVQNES